MPQAGLASARAVIRWLRPFFRVGRVWVLRPTLGPLPAVPCPLHLAAYRALGDGRDQPEAHRHLGEFLGAPEFALDPEGGRRLVEQIDERFPGRCITEAWLA